jgi:hypothetical protein
VRKKRRVSLVLDMIANFDDPKLSKKKRLFTIIDDNFLETLREELIDEDDSYAVPKVRRSVMTGA